MQRAPRLLILTLAALAACTAPAAAECKLSVLADLPATMEGSSPNVMVSLNGVETPIIVDSGAVYSVLLPEMVAKLGLHPTFTDLRMAGIGGSTAIEVATVAKFGFAGVTLNNVEFITGDPRAFQFSGSGLLGQNILRGFDVEYDLGAGRIRLLRSEGDCSRNSLAYWTKDPPAVVDIDATTTAAPHLRGTVAVNGQKIRAMFDTGASTSLLSEKAAAKFGINPQAETNVASEDARGIGRGSVQTWVAPFEEIEIGGERIRNTKMRVGALDLGSTDMLIGADFFLSHRVVVSTRSRRIYFTYSGGPVFHLDAQRIVATAPTGEGPAPPQAGATAQNAGAEAPMDAAALIRRGRAFMARRQFAAAAEDFSRAVALEPKNPEWLRARGEARLAGGQTTLAMADLNDALALKPEDLDALMGRGILFLRLGDEARARADLEMAVRVAGPDRDPRPAIGGAYADSGRFDEALGYFNGWIADHPKDPGLAMVLNNRCWLRASFGRELERALADCEAALKLQRLPGILDSRALVRLKLGRYDDAIADYDAVLKERPKWAWSTYARGVAKRRRGLKSEGEADMARALVMDSAVSEQAKKAGLDESVAAPPQALAKAPAG